MFIWILPFSGRAVYCMSYTRWRVYPLHVKIIGISSSMTPLWRSPPLFVEMCWHLWHKSLFAIINFARDSMGVKHVFRICICVFLWVLQSFLNYLVLFCSLMLWTLMKLRDFPGVQKMWGIDRDCLKLHIEIHAVKIHWFNRSPYRNSLRAAIPLRCPAWTPTDLCLGPLLG